MSSVSDSGISISGESTTELSTSGLSLKTDRSKSPHLYFKDERISTSSVSDSGISISGESTTELSTSGLSLKTDRSKSPHLYFKDERISTRELVSAWLDQVEIRSSELLDPEKEPLEQVSNSEEEMKRLCRLLHEIGDSLERDDLFQEAIKRLDAKSNRQRLVQTMLLLGGAGLIAIMSLLKL